MSLFGCEVVGEDNFEERTDADPGRQDPVLWRQKTNTHGLPSPVEEKGMVWPLSQEESTPTLALTGFYCFSGHITLRMILIYCAHVPFRWLQKTKERVLLVT